MVYRPKVDDKLCFVLMPFHEPFNGNYEHIIKKAVRATDLEPLRADEIYDIKSLIRGVWEHIWRARVVIADVTGRNPNVNYELGLCHSLGVPTILITQRMEDVPVDYQHRRCIVYQMNDATWTEKLSIALERTIRAVLSDSEDDQELQWPYDTFAVKGLVGAGSTISVENPRQIIVRGMATVERLISRAFGPRGSNVSITLPSHQVVSHKQGSIIVEGIHSANPIEENGIEQMRRVGRHISTAVGDGTKMAMLLTYGLVQDGQSALSQGHPLKDVLSGMEKAVTAALSSIITQSRVCTVDCRSSIALSACGDQALSELVLDATNAAGEDGVIIVETKSDSITDLCVQEGLRFDRGYLSDKFVTDAGTAECELIGCRVLVHESKISNMKDLLPVLEDVARAGNPLLVIADEVEGEALATLVVNTVRGAIKSVAVRAPGAGDRRRALLQDIAILTGAKFISADVGPKLESVRLADLGMADKIVVTKDDTTILGGHGQEGSVQAHIEALRLAIDRTQEPHDREKLQERLANLVGKIAVIRVGGTTEVDIEERRYRTVSALNSVRAAIKEGWSYGGGVALLNAKDAIAAISLNTQGQKAGGSIVSKALEAPFSALAESCQKSPVSLLIERQRFGQPTTGLNVETGNLEDTVTARIMDPTKTLRIAVDAAFSYARAILKTDIWSISSEPADDGPDGF